MAVPFSNTKLRVPRGFQNVLEGLAREVLRHQPQGSEEIYKFGADYFEHLLNVREEEGFDPVEHGARLEDRFYNNKSFKQPDVDPSNPQQQDAALTIQTKYRQHHATQEVQSMREDQAAVKIQAGYRGHQDREKVKDIKNQEDEEIDIDLDDPEVEKAATKIQAGFKGMQARKRVQDIKSSQEPDASPAAGTPPPSASEVPPTEAPAAEAATYDQAPAKEEEEEIDIDLNDPEVEKAATKIQAGFKGMQARKRVQGIKESKSSEQVTPTQEEKEEVDIDLNDPEVDKAATKIQAGFKGMQARKRVKAMKEDSGAPAEQETKKEEEEEVDIDLNDPEVEKAATKIQAGFKGLQARKQVKEMKESKTNVEATEAEAPAAEAPAAEAKDGEEEEIDIDLEDPEVEKAATKIQAGFKGLKARKQVKEMKESKEGGEADDNANNSNAAPAEAEEAAAAPEQKDGEEEEIDIDLNDPEVEKAATKIQAGFKGLKARKQVKEMKDAKAEDDGAPAEEAPAEETPATEAPAEEAPTEEAPAAEAPTEEAAPAEGGGE